MVLVERLLLLAVSMVLYGRRVMGEGGGSSDGEAEDGNDAVHSLVLPPHRAAACNTKHTPGIQYVAE